MAGAMFLSVKTGKLNTTGALVGGMVGFLVFAGAGYTGVAMLATFFILASAATSWKRSMKEAVGSAEKNKGKRNAGQVLANGGVAALLGLLALILPQKTILFQLMMAASLASATADTLSSELGTVYGKRYYNILTLKKDTRGLDGVISWEGSMIGVIGSVLIAFVYACGFGWSLYVFWIIAAGTIGNIADSILGAALERRHYINNNVVNFLNTVIAAVATLLLYTCFV